MQLNIIIAVFISFAIAAICGPFLIPFLRRLKFGQTEREELVSHQKKAGTPTMGGIMFLIAISVAITIIGGLIPATKASSKDPVEALRSE